MDNNQLVPHEQTDAEMAVVPLEMEPPPQASEAPALMEGVSIPHRQDNQLMLMPIEREPSPIEWEVKRVIDKQINTVTGNVEYLLEWKNWDGPPTWEPEENCDCKNLIRRFEKSREYSRSQNQSLSQRKKKKVQTLRSSSSSSPSEIQPQQEPMLALPMPSTSAATISEEQPARRRSTRVHARQQRRVIDEITIGSSSSTTTNTSSSSSSECSDDEEADAQSEHDCPRAKTPASVASKQSSCSDLSIKRDINVNQLRRERKLVLKDIVGAVNTSREIMLIVKWHGITNLEKIPLEILRRFHSQEVVDYLVSKIRWAK